MTRRQTYDYGVQANDLQDGELACAEGGQYPAEERRLGVHLVRREALEEGPGHVQDL